MFTENKIFFYNFIETFIFLQSAQVLKVPLQQV